MVAGVSRIASGAVDADYAITYTAGTLTVTAAPLTITADSKSKVYGAALPALTVTYTGLVNADTPATFATAPNIAPAIATPATAASHAGSYPITASGAVDADYAITYTAGTLRVTAAPLTITADSKTKIYGAALPALTASYSGFVNGDTPASLTTPVSLGTVTTASSPVGNYTITASRAVDTDYIINFVSGTLKVNPAPLTITANNTTKVFNAPNPSFTVGYNGFVNGDTVASLGGTLLCTTTAVTTSPVGSYPIACSGLTSSNYAFAYVNGTLQILYATGGMCDGDAGHQILQPINAGGTMSVFKMGSTVPTKFRVCDANGVSIGTPGVVTGYGLLAKADSPNISVDEDVYSTTPDMAFRWDSTGQQWIFNQSTKNNPTLNRIGATYYFQINLNDGSYIQFQYGLK